MDREQRQKLIKATTKFIGIADYDSAFQCIQNLWRDGKGKQAYKVMVAFRQTLKEVIAQGYNPQKNYELLRLSYVETARDMFDDFMVAVEWYRPAEEKFWLPRREKLLPVCEELQNLADGKVDELFLSMPPRVGKSTIVMFFMIWEMCRFPEVSNLYSSFTEKVVKTFYNGILEVMQDESTYCLREIFPEFKLARTDSKDLLIDVARKKRYPTLTSRSVDGSLNGSCDCEGVLVADDLHSGIDEARSKEQLIKKWETVRANLLSRKKGQAKILWIGTHWSLIDCISNRIEMLKNSPDCANIKYKVFNVPALDENDESNFDYLFHKGFSTTDFKAIRASYELQDDMALWLAPYQGTPIEREGTLFAPGDLRYYYGELPMDEDPDRIFMAVDPAWGGGDFTAAPVIYQYGQELFVHDVVYSNADKSITIPEVVEMAIRHNVSAIYIEGTRTTASYAEEVSKRLKDVGAHVNVQTSTKHWTNTGKQARIYDKAPEIRQNMLFLDTTHRHKAYGQFVQNIYSFTAEGRNKHDDAPDSLAMALVFAFMGTSRAVLRNRIF